MTEQFMEQLVGHRILILGTDGTVKKMTVQGLQDWKRAENVAFEIMNPETTEKESRKSECMEEEIQGQSQKVNERDFVIITCSSRVQDGWQEFLVLSGLLEKLQKRKPKAVLLLSDTKVYGKIFGTSHPLKEDEMGYVCHTDPKDESVQCMRTLEYLCSRMGREEGFPVKIARADWEGILSRDICAETPKTGEEQVAGKKYEQESSDQMVKTEYKQENQGIMLGERLAYHMLQIMLEGIPGEAYNLPGAEELKKEAVRNLSGLPTGSADSAVSMSVDTVRSPLSPIPVVPDTGKAGRL